jgi:alpha-D-ribose 1-methylphosphonate 5-triphosphate diphosphatase
MTSELILTNARVVGPEEVFLGSVFVRGGFIVDVQPGSTSSPSALDFEGDFLLPGLVELHTDNLEINMIPRPGVHWAPVAALIAHDAQVAAVGITTVLDAVCIGLYEDSVVRTPQILERTMRTLLEVGADLSLRAQHLLHIRLELAHEQTVSTFSGFVNEPRVKLISIMDHTPGQRQYVDVSKYRKFYANRFRWTDEQIDEAVCRRLELQQAFGERNRRRLIELLRSTGIPIASHDDTTVEHVDEAHAGGMSISEFPTTLEAAERAHQLGMKVVVGAPNLVQGGSHSGNVSAQTLAQRGILDALSSDYVPISLLQAVFMLHERLQVALPEAVAKASSVPAQILKLGDRGVLAAGYLADLIRVRYLRDTPCVVAVWRSGKRVA